MHMAGSRQTSTNERLSCSENKANNRVQGEDYPESFERPLHWGRRRWDGMSCFSGDESCWLWLWARRGARDNLLSGVIFYVFSTFGFIQIGIKFIEHLFCIGNEPKRWCFMLRGWRRKLNLLDGPVEIYGLGGKWGDRICVCVMTKVLGLVGVLCGNWSFPTHWINKRPTRGRENKIKAISTHSTSWT